MDRRSNTFRYIDDRWMQHGACKGRDDLDWFSFSRQEQDKCREVCITCPVFKQCDNYAKLTHPEIGVWAGRFYYPSNYNKRTGKTCANRFCSRAAKEGADTCSQICERWVIKEGKLKWELENSLP